MDHEYVLACSRFGSRLQVRPLLHRRVQGCVLAPRRQLAMAIGADHGYGAIHGMDTITVWPRLAGQSPYFRHGQPQDAAVQHKVRERKGMTVAQRCLDNLFLARDNPRLLLACRNAEETELRRVRAREAMRRKRLRIRDEQAAHQVGGLVGAQLLAIEDSRSPSP